MYARFVPFVALCCLACTNLASPLQDRQASAPTVTVSNGVIVGTTTQYADATATNNKFLGIPFAKSPPLRFGMPEAAGPWNSPLVATTFKPGCPQTTAIPEQIPSGTSEDCLYLNVFTPAGTTAWSNKTVLFWVYGGNLQSGSAAIDLYDGSFMAANQDVVVVSFGYRINAFGFSNAPEIPISEQNVGFYDQRLALNWVRSNIQAFGGDPEKITIFGQSAGGYSVKYLLRLPPDPLPYRAAIMQSQATLILGNGADSWNRLAAELGCTGPSTLACVRAADGQQVEAIVTNQSLGFPPVEDRITYLEDVYPDFARGAANVPVMLGTNGQEASRIPFLLGLNGTPVIEIVQLLTSFLPVVGDVLTNILNAILRNNPVYNLVDALMTNLVFQCATAKLTQMIHDSGRPVWRYFYNASFPNTTPFPGAGAYHGAEIPEVFGTYSRENATAQQRALSQYMQSAWANFAKNPTSGPGWPAYGSAQNVANLGSNGSPGEVTIPPAQIDGICGLLGVLGGLNTALGSANASSPVAGALEQTLRLGESLA
ncbi:hypothetical protein M409DRAFT_67655 [Zasmidium cellare ATCC 36951]|uniref:Carboxylic ester hydrolase n=1 Tax=Zasmidium cellare ATCC 36951 TaxID=1080233 RepID=A0A6A6CFP3_ZASCE|nr:uncharacterized protein M409DRAFT_67655 [Zasmidium cellare ATCC 36951]KAF2164978.1 hypothetical protein M409DRAFT_67655 [Zasmidium cellare ATCC 36951]